MTDDRSDDPAPDPQAALALELVRLANRLGLRGLAQVAHGTQMLLHKRVQALADSEEGKELLRAEAQMWPRRFLDSIAANADRDVLPDGVAALRDIAAAEDITRDD